MNVHQANRSDMVRHEDDYEDEIWLEVLFAYSEKIDTPESFILPFFTRKKKLFLLLREVKPSLADRFFIKKILAFYNFFSACTIFSLKPVADWLLRFPAKMTRWFKRAHNLFS